MYRQRLYYNNVEKQIVLFLSIILALSSCSGTKDSVDLIDSYVNSINKKIETKEVIEMELSNLVQFANYGKCYYEGSNLVKIWAFEGSPYGYCSFNFFLKNNKLIATDIEFCDLKKEYWNTMDTVEYTKTNSVIDLEKSYFINEKMHLTIKNLGKIETLNHDREKVILDQYADLKKSIDK